MAHPSQQQQQPLATADAGLTQQTPPIAGSSRGGGFGGVGGDIMSGRRFCWECQRRRLVCDSARPVCSKCKLSGIVCPGYDDKKPLTWVTPNKVTTRNPTRNTKNRRPAANEPAPAKKTQKTPRGGDKKETVRKATSVSRPSEGELIHIFPGHELRTETCDIAEASLYWNEHVYPYFYDNQLTKSPWVVPVSQIQKMTEYRRHGLVAMAIEHRMSRLSPMKGDRYAAEVRARAYHHRSIAIKALNKQVHDENNRRSDATLVGVLVFLFGDLMGSATAPNWRVHINGFSALIALRGGWEEFCRKSPHMKSVVLFCKIIENLANTTSPADDQIASEENFKIRDVLRDVYSIGYYPQLPCPVDLFIDITQINRVRFLSKRKRPGDTEASILSEAEHLLKKISNFSPETWFKALEHALEGHLLMAKIYQSAVLLFGISSLQSAGAIRSSEKWTAVKKTHVDKLFSLLDRSTASPALKICAAWPTIVAGFEAKGGSVSRRTFILGRLEEDSQRLGIYLPVAAKEVLEKFYASAGTKWDDCFDSPHALFT